LCQGARDRCGHLGAEGLYELQYIYQVETETRVYEFIGNHPQAFRLGDSITFTFDKDHQHALVIGGSGKKASCC
jgi:hypothetical protein